MKALFALVLLLGCRAQTEVSCESDDGCPLGAACIGGECTTNFCTTSRDCPMETHCGEERACAAGCEADADCFPGFGCTDGACAEEACVDTLTDCGWRETCVLGECADAGDDFCAPCTKDSDCARGVCWAEAYCGVDCDTRDGCPSGFDCLEVTGTDGDLHKQCISACWAYSE